MSRQKGQPKKRLNLDLIMTDWGRLDDLCAWMDKGYAETIRYIIRAWHDIGTELRQGGKLRIHRSDGTEAEIVLSVEEDRR